MSDRFLSGFSAKLEAFLEFRVARGFKTDSYLRHLVKFDRYCAACFPGQRELTRESVHGWLDSLEVAINSFRDYATPIRQFGLYLCAVGAADGAYEDAYVLPEKYAPNTGACNAYIFTDSEMTELFNAIDDLSPIKSAPQMNVVAPVMFRLIYTCGLRPNEGRELLAENVDLKTGVILITGTKRNKERLIVMSDDMRHFARKYDTQRNLIAKDNPYFFPAEAGGAFTSDQVYKAFNKAWVQACSKKSILHRRVRVYDLRHRFASACLNRWLDNGENLNNMLPYLRTYMGHSSLSETAYYIHILPENLVNTNAVNWDVFNAMMPEVDAE